MNVSPFGGLSVLMLLVFSPGFDSVACLNKSNGRLTACRFFKDLGARNALSLYATKDADDIIRNFWERSSSDKSSLIMLLSRSEGSDTYDSDCALIFSTAKSAFLWQHLPTMVMYINSVDTCPNAITPSAKKVTVKPMNNVKKVRFAEPLTSSSKIQQDLRITKLGNKKNKVEAQPRKVNKVNRVVKPICDVDVKHSLSNANSEILCATCNKSMFDGVHDKCLLDLVQNGNKRTKSAKKHKKQNI
ncbi:hypothetical protein Tco_1523933 [Tanacetum coccineum]